MEDVRMNTDITRSFQLDNHYENGYQMMLITNGASAIGREQNLRDWSRRCDCIEPHWKSMSGGVGVSL